MGKVLIIKGADFSNVSVGKSYATETEQLIHEALEQDNINVLLNQSGSINSSGTETTDSGYVRSTYIPIDELKDISFYGQNYATLGAVYDSSKNFISVLTGIQYAKFAHVNFNDVASISGAKYVRLTTISGLGALISTNVDDNSAYKVHFASKVAELGIGDITSLTKSSVIINSITDYGVSANQKSTLPLPLSAFVGKTITNNGTYSSSVAPFAIYKENMQKIDYSQSVTANVPITVDVDTLISTYSNAVFIAMCVDVRATNPTIVVAQGS